MDDGIIQNPLPFLIVLVQLVLVQCVYAKPPCGPSNSYAPRISQEEVEVFGTKGHPLQSLFHKG